VKGLVDEIGASVGKPSEIRIKEGRNEAIRHHQRKAQLQSITEIGEG